MIDFYLVGQMVKKAREKKGYTQAKLSEIVNISSSFLSQIETGTKNGGFETYVSIANALDVTLDYLTQNVVTRAELNFLTKEFQNQYESLNAGQRRFLLDVMKSMKENLE